MELNVTRRALKAEVCKRQAEAAQQRRQTQGKGSKSLGCRMHVQVITGAEPSAGQADEKKNFNPGQVL